MIELNYGLYNHQREAFEKLRKFKVGALFMDMGTGKTRTALELIKDKVNAGKVDKVIWACPCLAKTNIKNELYKQVKSGHEHFMIVGIESLSSSVRLNSYLYYYVQDHRCLIVCDESSKIKNFDAKRSQNLIRLGEFCDYKYILNGTPISRNEIDLFSQMYFLDWRILGYKSQWSFERNHVTRDKENWNRILDIRNTDYLAKRTSLYSYQVKLEDCHDMPKQIYEKVYFDLEYKSAVNYSEMANDLLFEVDEMKPSTIYRLFGVLLSITSGYIYDRQSVKKIKFLNDEKSNPRLECLLDVVADLGGKVIIYAKFIDEILAIEKMLNRVYGDGSAVTFYGELSKKERNKNEESFKNKARFLITNKASSSFSMNWQFCNQIIYYNNDWDWGTRSQSEKRIYRIGQEKPCLYIDIVADGTIEEHVMDCLVRKEDLADSFGKRIENKSFKELVAYNKLKGKEKIKLVDDLKEDRNA